MPWLRIVNRDWGDFQKLDLITAPEGYTVWRERAMGFLAKDRPDVHSLLEWAEKQEEELTEDATEEVMRRLEVHEDQATINYVLHGAIKLSIGDSLLGRAIATAKPFPRGLALWRPFSKNGRGVPSR